MKRLIAFTVLVGLLTAAAATLGSAAPSGPTGQSAAAKLPAKPKLPALPADVKSRGNWEIGVKCDTPPFGWQDTSGRNRGYDVEVARQFANLGVRVGEQGRLHVRNDGEPHRNADGGPRGHHHLDAHVDPRSASSRSTTPLPYYGAAGKLLVKNDVIGRQAQDWMKGKKIVSTSGSIYDRWIKNCFKQTTFQVVSSPSAGVLAVKNGQADALMYDDAFPSAWPQTFATSR